MNLTRVVHVLSSIEYSGAEIMLYQASDIFKENQIHTTLLAGAEKIGRFEGPMLEKGYVIDHIRTEARIQVLIKFFQYFNKNKFDVVIMHVDDLYLWRIIILRLTGHNNIVRTYHSCWGFTGWLRFKRAIHRRLAVWLGVKNHAIGLAVQENEKRVFNNDCVIITNWIKLNDGIFKTKDNIRSLKRAELGIEPGAFVIISVGGCAALKNHPFIINLIGMLNDEGLKVTYLHVGAGDEEESEKALAKKIDVYSQIIFAGTRKDVPELLLSADVYLMPSEYEGLSIALLEAMYYNGLVIVNDPPALKKMIVQNETGFVINVEKKLDYIDLLKKIQNNSIDVLRIKSAAKKFVEENFNLEKNARALIEFYKEGTKPE